MSNVPITVTHLEAENLFRFERVAIDPQKLTLLRGANNAGKTSVLRILSVLAKGTDNAAAVIRDGASKGSGSISFSNGYTLQRSFTSAGEKGRHYLKLMDEHGHVVPDPQKTVNAWLGELSDFNPLTWLEVATSDSVDDRRRALRILLQAIDVRLTGDEFTAVTGLAAPAEVSFEGHALEVLEALKAHYAEERKYENRIAAEKKAAANEARAILPAHVPEITDERKAEVAAAQATAREMRESFKSRELASTNYAAALERNDADQAAALAENATDDEEIARLEEQINRIRNRQQARLIRVDELRRERETLAQTAPPTEDERAAVNAAIERAKTLTDALAADEKILARFAEVAIKEQEAADAAASASILSETIKTIETDLRARVMERAALPVDSLTIDGGRILIGGHPIENIAESQQIRVALSIARSLNPTLRMIALDGTERLDRDTFQVFLEEIAGDGFGYLCTEVSRDGGPLEIVMFGETAEGVTETGQVPLFVEEVA